MPAGNRIKPDYALVDKRDLLENLDEMKSPHVVKIACLLFAALLANVVAAQAAITITNLAQGCTANHSLFLKSDGSLWGMGDDADNDLGDGLYYGVFQPEEIVTSNVTAIAVGTYHSLFVKSDGSLWAMGNNALGQLGTGTREFFNQPEEIVTSGVIAVAAGSTWSLFLKSDGSVWAMGNASITGINGGFFGFLEPEEIITNGVTAIAAGEGQCLFLKSDGSLWAMGLNLYSALGDGTYYSDNPVTNQPEEIVANSVTAIAAGGYHNLFLKSDGSLWGAGFNAYGQLGIGSFSGTNRPVEIVASNVTAIAAGGYHSLFIKSDGSLWAMGDNGSGQLGDGTYNSEVYEPEEIVASNVTAVAAGEIHSLFLKSDGSLWGMGDDTETQLGDGFHGGINESIIPEQILPKPAPVLTQTVSNADLQFTATCPFGGNFYLLTSTNLALPLSQWTPVWTNDIIYRYLNVFSATLTNAVNSGGPQFYILQSP